MGNKIQEELQSTFGRGEVKQRQGYDYVEIQTVVQRLNDVLGYNGWGFEVMERIETEIEFIVFGKITVYAEDGSPVTKVQVGRKKIGFKKNSTIPLDLGNDWKAAFSDCIKKCASLLGVGLYLTEDDSRNENNSGGGQRSNNPPPPPPPPPLPNQPDDNTENESPQGDGASSDIMAKRKEVHNVEKQVLAMHGGTRNKLRQSLLDGSINLPPTMEDLATYQITLEKMLTDGKDA